LSVLAACLVSVVAIEWSRARAARTDHLAARATFDTLRSEVEELVRLRAALAPAARDGQPTQDVLGRISAAIADAGLSPASLRSVTSEGEAAIGPMGEASGGIGTAARRQTLALSLDPITPAELGKFLAAWNARGGAWSPLRIEMSKSLAPPSEAGAFGPVVGNSASSNTYAARIDVSAVVVPQGVSR
jgi:hypothetical protein